MSTDAHQYRVNTIEGWSILIAVETLTDHPQATTSSYRSASNTYRLLLNGSGCCYIVISYCQMVNDYR